MAPERAHSFKDKQEGTPHGAKAAEVYGIVGYLLSLMTFGSQPVFVPLFVLAVSAPCPPARVHRP